MIIAKGERNKMDSVTQNRDGIFQWSCRIDKEFHRQSVWKGLLACMLLVVFVLLLFLLMPSTPGQEKTIWPALIPIVTVLVIALPLIFLQYNASDPHEQYIMTDEYIKSGYGKSAIYTNFKETDKFVRTTKFIELTDKHKTNRIYVPADDMEFVCKYIRERLPQQARGNTE